MKILITGATGFIGKELGKKLVRLKHEFVVVSRDKASAKKVLPFPATVLEHDITKKPLTAEQMKGIDGVVHLAGENIAGGRWTKEKKEKILQSRKTSTENLRKSLDASSDIKAVVSASAIGIYGDRKDEELTEGSSYGNDFLTEVCKEWEKPWVNYQKSRLCILRFGVVLSSFEGAFPKMLMPYLQGVGGQIGDGKAWMSWIHIEDLTNLIIKSLTEQSLSGVINAVAPTPCQNKEFSKEVSAALNKKEFFPDPKIALKTLLGEMSQIVTDSQRVFSKKLGSFPFQYKDIQSAVRQITEPYKDGDEVFYTEQFVDKKKEEIFESFADAKNLEKITPEWLNFKILRTSDETVKAGTLIDYKLKIHGVPVTWKTRIEGWNPPNSFVDTQLSGPYQKWHHTHGFEDLGSGTLLTDLVKYKVPMGALGSAVAGWYVRGDVKKIFQYRQEVIARDF